jgi:hypothetical protein
VGEIKAEVGLKIGENVNEIRRRLNRERMEGNGFPFVTEEKRKVKHVENGEESNGRVST